VLFAAFRPLFGRFDGEELSFIIETQRVTTRKSDFNSVEEWIGIETTLAASFQF